METPIKNWSLRYNGGLIKAAVPGDITADLMRSGIIGDIQFADNYLKYKWVHEREWVYETEFGLTEEELSSAVLRLDFGGIDTYSAVTLNGEPLGTTDNMFLPYSFCIKGSAKKGKNKLTVTIMPVTRELEAVGTSPYGAAFDNRRMLLRKAQCHFGWDWAPDYPGLGIYRPVKLVCGNGFSIDYVRTIPRTEGSVTFITETSYSPRLPQYGEYAGDIIRITVSGRGGQTVCAAETVIDGFKTLLNAYIPRPELWYPNGYGNQPLYSYTAEIVRGTETVSVYSGSFGLREIEVKQPAAGGSSVGCKLFVNGAEVFLKGSNWVPADFMTGCITREKYAALIRCAKEAGFNVLRVWGGGIYEDDCFYSLCDEAGILIWHDFMFACADVPDDRDAFNRAVTKEAVYQVRRLNDHPCIALWNGGNEILNTFRYNPHNLGEYLIRYILAGVVNEHSNTPYLPACPYSLTDFENDTNSGDCHKCLLFEADDYDAFEGFRDCIIHNKPLTTESAALGPCRLRSLKKFIPGDKLWPINEIWALHFVSNPYEPKLPPSFAHLEEKIASSLFGKVTDVKDFAKKAMIAHSEVLGAEIDFALSDRKICGGILNWMYNDIWSNGTWSVVDFCLEKKPAFYTMKRAFRPLRAFILKKNGRLCACVSNDTAKSSCGILTLSCKAPDGKALKAYSVRIDAPPYSSVELPLAGDLLSAGGYLSAEYNGVTETFFHNGWKAFQFTTGITVNKGEVTLLNGGYACELTLCAHAYARTVFIDLPDGLLPLLSDNYFDMEAGTEKTVTVFCDKPYTATQIKVLTFADEWDE